MMGRFDEAGAQDRRAQELEPLSLVIKAIAGRDAFFAGRHDAAIEQYYKTLEMEPDFWVARVFLAEALIAKGKHKEALDELRIAKPFSEGHTQSIAQMGRAYARMGQRADALKVIEQLKALSQDRYVPPCRVALVYASLGETDQALYWLEKAYAERDLLLWFLKVEPAYNDLHSEARYIDLLRRLGLADKATGRDQGIHSVAVLPFKNIGDDPKTEFLSDGVAEQIINSLSQVRRRDLKVRPFTSVARYKGKEPDVPTFGRELNVRMIVSGTLQQQGDDLTVRVALVGVQEESQLWGKQYQRKLIAILDLQDEIARDVAVNLRLQLTGEEEQRLTMRHTEDPDAYRLYREAIYHFSKITEQGIETAIDYCQRAVSKDPKYALAHATLGRCYLALGSIYRGPKETYPEARKHLIQALEIDNALPEAHAGIGVIYLFHDWNWAAAERELKLGSELESNGSSWNRTYYGFYLAAIDKLPEALASIRRSQELDPLAAGPRHNLAECYNRLRQPDQAIAEAQEALKLDPKFVVAYGELGLAYTQKGMPEKALEVLHKGKIQGLIGYVYAQMGQPAEARRELQALNGSTHERRYGAAFAMARIHAALGEKNEAFKWLQTACDERDPRVIWLKVDPTLDNLRSDPMFIKLLKDMGLPP